MKLTRLLFTLVLLPLAAPASGAGDPAHSPAPARAMVRVGGGSFRPLFAQPGETVVSVQPFLLDARAVTRAEFEEFVRTNARWQRGTAPRLFVDADYLKDWAGPADAGTAVSRHLPVTHVSWFAAKSYCESLGARLPSTHEWEWAARADEDQRDAALDSEFRGRMLSLALGRKLQPVETLFRNAWGAWDMHGGVQEWVYDFQSIFAGADSRVTSRLERGLTCAAGVTTTGNPDDYAAYLRYALRGTLEARTGTGTLGFRCARSL